jgi:hypothetical protein
MGRLIDADAFERSVMCSDAEDMQDVIYALRDYPTAYDPDKVVEQLEELRKECEDPLQDYDPNYFIDKAIEIVKGGGVK